MKFKIVQQYNDVTVTEIASETKGEHFIDGVTTLSHTSEPNKSSPSLIVVPSHFKWLYSQRYNKYYWMEPPFDNRKC